MKKGWMSRCAALAMAICMMSAVAPQLVFATNEKTYDFSTMADATDIKTTIPGLSQTGFSNGKVNIADGKLVLDDTNDAADNGPGVRLTFMDDEKGAEEPITTDFSYEIKFNNTSTQYIRVYGKDKNGVERQFTNIDFAMETSSSKFRLFIYMPNNVRVEAPPSGGLLSPGDHDYTIRMDFRLAEQQYDISVTSDAFSGLTAGSGQAPGVLEGNVFTIKNVDFFAKQTVSDNAPVSANYVRMEKTKSTGTTSFDYIDVIKPETAAFAVSGTVTDSEGSLAGAAVRLYAAADGDKKTVASTLTGADGAFTMTDVPAGSYLLETSMEEYETATQELSVTDADVEHVAVTLTKAVVPEPDPEEPGIHEDFSDVSSLADLTWLVPGKRGGAANPGTVSLAETPDGMGGQSVLMDDQTSLAEHSDKWSSPTLAINLDPALMQGKSYLEMEFKNGFLEPVSESNPEERLGINLFMQASAQDAAGKPATISKLAFDANDAGQADAIRLFQNDDVSADKHKVPGDSFSLKYGQWYTLRLEFDTQKDTYDLILTSESFKSYTGLVAGADATLDQSTGTYTRRNIPYFKAKAADAKPDVSGGISQLLLQQGKGYNKTYIKRIDAGPITPATVKSVKFFQGGTDVSASLDEMPTDLSEVQVAFATPGKVPINSDTVNADTVKLYQTDGGGAFVKAVSTQVAFDAAASTARLAVKETLGKGKTYAVEVTTGVQSVNGLPLKEGKTVAFTASIGEFAVTETAFKVGADSVALADVKAGDAVRGSVTVAKKAGKEQTVAVLLAYYQDGCLIDAKVTARTLAAQDTAATIETDAVTAEADRLAGRSMRLYVWETMDNQKPLTRSVGLE